LQGWSLEGECILYNSATRTNLAGTRAQVADVAEARETLGKLFISFPPFPKPPRSSQSTVYISATPTSLAMNFQSLQDRRQKDLYVQFQRLYCTKIQRFLCPNQHLNIDKIPLTGGGCGGGQVGGRQGLWGGAPPRGPHRVCPGGGGADCGDQRAAGCHPRSRRWPGQLWTVGEVSTGSLLVPHPLSHHPHSI